MLTKGIQDLSLLGFILNSGRSLVIVVNKWDGLSQEVKEQVKETLDFRLGFIDFARVHFISALHGSGVGNLFESVREAYDSSTRRVGTSMLTRIMTMAVEDHQPPLVRGRRVKLKYAHAGAIAKKSSPASPLASNPALCWLLKASANASASCPSVLRVWSRS